MRNLQAGDVTNFAVLISAIAFDASIIIVTRRA
jgi:hypothetical protein